MMGEKDVTFLYISTSDNIDNNKKYSHHNNNES